MKAAVLHAPGPPSAFNIEDIPPPSVGPDDVLIDVRACGVSFHDVVERNGTYRRGVTYPNIIGLEISGIIAELGDAVQDLQVGDQVCTKAFASCGRCRYCRNGKETACIRRRGIRGGYAECVAVPSDAVVKVPTSVPFEVSCVLGAAAGVALNAVRDVARVSLGEDVLVTGATGGVGWSSMQLAKLSGGRVIAMTRREAKRQPLLEGGADEVVVADTGQDFSSEVKALTDGLGVQVVIDNVGSRVFTPSFRSLAMHGRYAFVGQLFGEEVSINPARIFFKRAQLLGVGSVSRTQLEDTVKLVAAGKLSPRIATVLPLDRIAEAHALVEGGEMVGRVVITP